MYNPQVLVHRNIDRARHWLPFLHPVLRDLILIIPALFCEGSPSLGIYGHTTCTGSEYDLMRKYLGRRPEITPGRLPDRIVLDSLILLVRPCISNEFHCSLLLVCCPQPGNSTHEIRKKTQDISTFFRTHGISLSAVMNNTGLPQLLIYEIMRTGMVLAGKHPALRQSASSDSRFFIGEFPRRIADPSHVHNEHWNPFQCYIDREVTRFIEAADYPSPLSIPGANPFIIPYLHILHRYDENMDAGSLAKMRVSLAQLFLPFPPTHEAMKTLMKTWRITDTYHDIEQMTFENALQLRKWLIPPEQDELPVFSWPPLPHMALPVVNLCPDKDLWHITQVPQFRHRYPWVVLMWGAIAGIIGCETKLFSSQTIPFKNNMKQRLLSACDAIDRGVDIIVPQDHTQGSIRRKKGRFFFSDDTFAILENGNKHSLELFEEIKKKALLDDIDL